METGSDLNFALNDLVKDAARAKVVIGGSICIGELLMWDSERVCFFFENELGERTVAGFADMRSFVGWVEKRLGAGHNIRFA